MNIENQEGRKKQEFSVGRNEKLTLVKKIGKIGVWFFCIVGLSILFMKTLSRHDKLTCSKIDLKIENSGGNIDGKRFVNQIKARFPIINKTIRSVNIQDIERFVKTNPFVRNSELFFDLKGVLHISIWQKIPALQVNNLEGEKFIIDEEGSKMPMVSEPDSALILVKGDIHEKWFKTEDSLRSPELKMAYLFWKRISRETGSLGKISAFDIEPINKMNILLRNLEIPMVFGDTSLFSEKMDKMNIFLSSILPKMGAKAYSQVDLRFAHEWVCEKKIRIPQRDSLPKSKI